MNERDLSAPRWMSGPIIPAVVAGVLGIVGIGAEATPRAVDRQRVPRSQDMLPQRRLDRVRQPSSPVR
ncbi:MAG TPA: hypothetical protein VIK08_11015 [Candidatus Limnocylindrales bacterium]